MRVEANGNGFAVPPSPSLPHEGGEGRGTEALDEMGRLGQ